MNPIGSIGDFGGQTREPLENVGRNRGGETRKERKHWGFEERPAEATREEGVIANINPYA